MIVTPMELALECKRVVEDGRRTVTIVVPGPPPRGQRVRLVRTNRRKCPMGEVADWMDDPPRTVGLFDAYEVLAWLSALGLVTVDVRTVEEPE